VRNIIMKHNKFSATQLFDGYNFLPAGKVLLTSAEGVIIDIVNTEDAGDDVQYFEGILTPGFINCHCHIELSHLKNAIPQHTGLVNFVQQVMSKRTASNEEKLAAMQTAEAEMYNSGTVAVGDICSTSDSLLIKQNSKQHWHNFIEVSGFVDAGAQKRLTEIQSVAEKYSIFNLACRQAGIQYSIVPHASYSVSKKLFELINNLPNNNLISIHNQEAAAENELYKNKEGDFLQLYKNFGIDISSFTPSGKTSLQTWLPYFTNNQNIIAVHNTFTSEEDLNFAKSYITHRTSNIAYCLCPNANLYIENSLPPIDLLLKNNCNIVLGTDSLASNTQLNIWEEIKMIQQHFPQIELQTLLQWATSNGAVALQMSDTLGSFEKGKQPGLVLINKNFESARKIL
jgi:aminodeoxyfutalosine deaminase